MDANFWHDLWATNTIAFHQSVVNPLLSAYFDDLALTEDSRIFVPLCGKTLDIGWLLGKGYAVAGAELSELAIQQLFNELGVAPQIAEMGELKHYSAPNLDIYVGDIFDLTPAMLGRVHGIFDRAALVALPPAMRARYTQHLTELTRNAPQLLITFAYNQALMEGPPFSVNSDEVKRHYDARYKVVHLLTQPVAGGLRGIVDVTESAWVLKRLK